VSHFTFVDMPGSDLATEAFGDRMQENSAVFKVRPPFLLLPISPLSPTPVSSVLFAFLRSQCGCLFTCVRCRVCVWLHFYGSLLPPLCARPQTMDAFSRVTTALAKNSAKRKIIKATGKMAKAKHVHVPYSESVLTNLLRPHLDKDTGDRLCVRMLCAAA